MTRTLATDPFRSLPEPDALRGAGQRRPAARGPGLRRRSRPRRAGAWPASSRRRRAAVKGATRSCPSPPASTTRAPKSLRVHSNGFEGARVDTSFWTSAAGHGEGRRRPPARGLVGGRACASSASCRAAAEVGRDAARARAGAPRRRRRPSPRCCPWWSTTAPRAGWWARCSARCSGQALQQKRSFLEGKLGTAVGSAKLTFADDPLVPKGLRLAPLRRRGHRRAPAARLRGRRAAELLHRHLLRQEAGAWRRPPAAPSNLALGAGRQGRRRRSSPT